MNRLNSIKLKVRPLTRKNLSKELYQRSEEVEAQINEALGLDSSALIDRAKISDHKEDGFLQEECLVYLIREALNCSDDRLANSLFEILLKRCVGYIYKYLKLDDDIQRDEAYSDVIYELTEQIINIGSDRGDFLQVRFWVVLERLAINAFNKSKPGPLETNNVVLDVEEIEQAAYTTDIGPLENLMMNEILDEAKKVLLELSEQHFEVFLLRHKDGWPIESQDPTKITLSTHFKVTPRTIRNWLAECEEALKESIGEEKK